MELAKIKNANVLYKAPPDQDDIVGDLHVRREEDLVFGTMLKSAWTPTEEEIGILLGGGSVILTIIGAAHPIVALSAEP